MCVCVRERGTHFRNATVFRPPSVIFTGDMFVWSPMLEFGDKRPHHVILPCIRVSNYLKGALALVVNFSNRLHIFFSFHCIKIRSHSILILYWKHFACIWIEKTKRWMDGWMDACIWFVYCREFIHKLNQIKGNRDEAISRTKKEHKEECKNKLRTPNHTFLEFSLLQCTTKRITTAAASTKASIQKCPKNVFRAWSRRGFKAYGADC